MFFLCYSHFLDYICNNIIVKLEIEKDMKKVSSMLLILAVSLVMAACGTTQTVPVTGRKHSLLVSDAQVLSLSKEEYSKYMRSATLSTNAANTDEIKNFAWEFNLVADKNVNAFCMPGGKIVVYEGLLPVTQDEASLAIVLGHEIAHAVAKHSAEQMSKKIRQSYGTQIGSQILGAIAGQSVGDLAGAVAQQGFSFANLRYSRDNETEADHIGLIFAAMAGYDPREAVPFWQRMAAQSGSNNSSDMFSDHPSDAKRIAAIQQWMPTAMKYYEASGYASKSVPTMKVSAGKKKTSKRRR